MAELLPSTSGKPPIEKLGLGLLIADTTSHDQIPPTDPVVEIQHSESSQNAPDEESDLTAVVLAEESAATNEEVELRNTLERDLYLLTIEQAEIETAHERLKAIDDEEGKDEGKVKPDSLRGEKNGRNPGSVQDENENVWGYMENEKTVEVDDFHEEKGGRNDEGVEDENEYAWGYRENEKTVKVDDLHEEKGGTNAEGVEDENEYAWGNIENERIVKLDYLHEEKCGKNAESFEDENVSGWGYVENGVAVKLDNLYEEKGGRNEESFEDENVNGWGYMENQGAGKLDNFYEEKGERNGESVVDEIENRWCNMGNEWGNEVIEGNARSKPGDAVTNLGRYNTNNNMRLNYPVRPDAEDCAFYMRFGSCKFGLNCKFNHPPKRKNQGVKERVDHSEENSERAGRAGQTECKYYLTSGGCRHGKDCKYSHSSDERSKSQNLEFNFLGLPMRSGEKECSYYMRTGTCKYGSSCRFHHPEPTTVAGADSSSGIDSMGPSQHVSSSSFSSWSSPRAFHETSPFKPVMFSRTQGAPTSNPEWNGYQAATYLTSERSLPTPPAFALNNLPTEINFPMPQQDMLLEEYPERLGEPECSFFMKTGDCKFKSTCKFHHPKNRISKSIANSCTLNDKGLPLRPDQPICTHYHRYGICKYGPACKYDHPSSFANLPTPFAQPPFRNLKIAGGSQ